jgi:hypothetical protein
MSEDYPMLSVQVPAHEATALTQWICKLMRGEWKEPQSIPTDAYYGFHWLKIAVDEFNKGRVTVTPDEGE